MVYDKKVNTEQPPPFQNAQQERDHLSTTARLMGSHVRDVQLEQPAPHGHMRQKALAYPGVVLRATTGAEVNNGTYVPATVVPLLR